MTASIQNLTIFLCSARDASSRGGQNGTPAASYEIRWGLLLQEAMDPLVCGERFDHQAPYELIVRADDLFSHPESSHAEVSTLTEALSQVRRESRLRSSI